MTRFHHRAALAVLTLGTALPLGGCLGPVNRGMESIKQPVVTRADHVFDVAYAGDRLAPGEAERLSGWFDTIDLRYGDTVSLDERGQLPTAGVRADVATTAGRYGLLLAPAAPITAGEVEPGRVRVVVSRTTATVADCPDWRGAEFADYSSSTTSNYGCATNRTLALMVANPEDLVHGREPAASVDASVSGKAVRLYRDRAPTGAGDLQRQSAGGGGGSSGGSN